MLALKAHYLGGGVHVGPKYRGPIALDREPLSLSCDLHILRVERELVLVLRRVNSARLLNSAGRHISCSTLV